jgi:hypothetical protein
MPLTQLQSRRHRGAALGVCSPLWAHSDTDPDESADERAFELNATLGSDLQYDKQRCQLGRSVSQNMLRAALP